MTARLIALRTLPWRRLLRLRFLIASAALLVALLAGASLALRALHPGNWTGRPDALTYQDVVVAERS